MSRHCVIVTNWQDCRAGLTNKGREEFAFRLKKSGFKKGDFHSIVNELTSIS